MKKKLSEAKKTSLTKDKIILILLVLSFLMLISSIVILDNINSHVYKIKKTVNHSSANIKLVVQKTPKN